MKGAVELPVPTFEPQTKALMTARFAATSNARDNVSSMSESANHSHNPTAKTTAMSAINQDVGNSKISAIAIGAMINAEIIRVFVKLVAPSIRAPALRSIRSGAHD